MSSLKTYCDSLLHNWELFVTTGEIAPSVKPYISAAWQKCYKNGLDPYKPGKLDVVTKAQYLQRMHVNEDLVQATAPVISKLYSHIPFVDIICVTDMEGLILDMFGDAETLEMNKKENNFIIGSYWNESLIGINIANVSMEQDQTLSLIGPENYLKAFHDTGSITAPIRAGNGKMIGCLCVIFSVAKIDNLETIAFLEQISSMSAYTIEREIDLIKSFKIKDKVFESISEGILVTDCNFLVTSMNRSAEKILNTSFSEFQSKDLTSIVAHQKSIIKTIEKEKSYSGEMIFKVHEKIINCNGTANELTFKYQQEGYIFVFNRTLSYNKGVNKTVGNIARYTFSNIISSSDKMLAVIDNAKRISRTDCNVLITGDSGTGKEMLAQSIHSASSRCNEPLVIVNCAALPRDLVESELFGYEKGAFTGASSLGMPGKFELANGGTLFLDEIGELPLEIQPKLLRSIESHKITRIAGKYEKEIDVRLICATNRNLSKEVAQNNFRLDLFYRINVISLQIPSLKERPSDIPLLAYYFINKLNQTNGTNKHLSPNFILQLQSLSMQGNVRQLENIITQSYYLTPDTVNIINNLPHYLFENEQDFIPDNVKTMQSIERDSIVAALRKHAGNVARVALELNIGRTTVYRKMEQYQISKGDYNHLL